MSRVEDAQAATRAEWDHLAEWVATLEHRVEGQDGDALRALENRLAVEEQKADALRRKSEQDYRAWEAQRQIYQAEIARLQAGPGDVPTTRDAPGPDSSVVEAISAENLRLRAAWQELVERTTAATEHSEAVDARLAEALQDRNQYRRQLEQIEDERKKERLEHQATVAELQTRLSQAALRKPDEPPAEKKAEGISSELDIELRVRALRHHFQEVHEREKEERRQKQLTSRLSRLWSRTGPR